MFQKLTNHMSRLGKSCSIIGCKKGGRLDMVDKIISIVDDLIGVKNRLQQNAVFFSNFHAISLLWNCVGIVGSLKKSKQQKFETQKFWYLNLPGCLSKGTSSATRASLEDSSAVTPWQTNTVLSAPEDVTDGCWFLMEGWEPHKLTWLAMEINLFLM